MILLVFLFSFGLYAQSYYTNIYEVEFKAYLTTELEDLSHAIKRQVNHSVGPSTMLKKPGYRSSLGHQYTYEILKTEQLDEKTKKVEYLYRGKLLTENYLSLDNYKVIMPLQAKKAFDKSRGKCAKERGLGLFYQSWSPHFRRCRLKLGQDYDEFTLNSFRKVESNKLHIKEEFLNNGQYNLFYYFGSDYYSLSRMGHSKKGYDNTIRYFKRKGFKRVYEQEEKSQIFKKDKTLSYYQKLSGTIDGYPAHVYLMAGNPTDTTPKAKYEFFRFFKYAFKNASTINYSGHAGLGTILDFDGHEKEYNEKIDYSASNKQLYLLSGCGTYLQATGFYFRKRKEPNSLVLITNGLSIYTSINKPSTYLIAQNFLEKDQFTNDELMKDFASLVKSNGANKKDYPMTAVESN